MAAERADEVLRRQSLAVTNRDELNCALLVIGDGLEACGEAVVETATIGEVLREHQQRWGMSKDGTYTTAVISAEQHRDCRIDGLVPALIESEAPFLQSTLAEFHRFRVEARDE